MSYYNKEALDLHKKLKGKVEISPKIAISTMEELSLLYSPGVAAPSLEIKRDTQKAYDYTAKGNTVAIISNGTAVLGLGDIGAEAGIPVMEGKSLLFKTFGDINAMPIMLDTKDSEEFIRTVELLSSNFGGINLEDIKAPECLYIERELQRKLNIPVFHDDQHGTAIVVLAGLINAFKYLGKNLRSAKIVVSGTGAAGSAIIKILYDYGVRDIYAFNKDGVVNKDNASDEVIKYLLPYLRRVEKQESLNELLEGADAFVGVSAPNILEVEDIKVMNSDPIIFALANPEPEINYDLALQAKASIVATGRSDYPNQVNNVLAFPGVFKGALSVRAREINDEMKLAAALAIAEVISPDEMSQTNIIPEVFDERVVERVAKAVANKAIETGVAQIK